MTVVKYNNQEKKGYALRLLCKVQHYDWGRRGYQSEVGRLYALQSNSVLEDDMPYAELWMGTHESGPSYVRDAIAGGDDDPERQSTVLLKDWLARNPHALGENALQRWGTDLPFLFKVLSVSKALSIQAHPDKKLARQLHQLYPHIYKDGNHKPEMALAISHFEALCGFLGPQEIKQVVEDFPELCSILGESINKALVELGLCLFDKEFVKLPLKAAFSAIMSAGQGLIREVLHQIILRLSDDKKQGKLLTSKEVLILRLAEQYPDDVGVLSALFMNYVVLKPGEALYLDANEPHAYLAGECVECMATSDNVVRAGLTSKYRDTETLCAMLSYKQGPPKILCGVPVYPHTKRYAPPLEEFEVDVSILPKGSSLSLPAIPGPSVVLVLEGEGSMTQSFADENRVINLRRGDIFFIPAGIKLGLVSDSACNDSLHLYRAGISSRIFTP